ncbi:hypothetical protein GF336_00995 [Candidatus Woesearchaeota archaeon]|nr:hypothetical protein [Candidatus Woesearchaeota archaeon]
MEEKDMLKEAKEIEKEPDVEKDSRNSLWWVLGIFLALLLIMMAVPYYGVKLDPRPSEIPGMDIIPAVEAGQHDFSVESPYDYEKLMKSSDPVIKQLADNIAAYGCSGNKICHAKAEFYFVRDNFNYINDPASVEYVKSAKESLVSRGGDCDDSSVLLANLLEAAGVETRFVFVPGHVYIEAYLPSALNRYKMDGDWVALDAACKSCEFGELSYNVVKADKRYV